MADEDRDEGITRAEFDELRSSLTGLSDAVRELREARTPDERREARQDVREAEEDLDATAKRLGVSRAKLEESIAAARKAERKEELREPLRELLEELRAESDDGDDEDGDAGKPKPKPKPKAKRKPASSSSSSSGDDGDDDGAGAGDTEPIVPHWTERGIGALLK